MLLSFPVKMETRGMYVSYHQIYRKCNSGLVYKYSGIYRMMRKSIIRIQSI